MEETGERDYITPPASHFSEVWRSDLPSPDLENVAMEAAVTSRKVTFSFLHPFPLSWQAGQAEPTVISFF